MSINIEGLTPEQEQSIRDEFNKKLFEGMNASAITVITFLLNSFDECEREEFKQLLVDMLEYHEGGEARENCLGSEGGDDVLH